MGSRLIDVVWDGEYNIKIKKWKIRKGMPISARQVIMLYTRAGAQDSLVLKFKSKKVGAVQKICIEEESLITPGDVLVQLEECTHPTVMADMCAECGADLRQARGIEVEASVPMVHSIPELKVSKAQAQILGKADETRLLTDKKLVLLVDLDQTLIHTTNDNIPPNLKDVVHFQLYGAQSPWYHTRIRPGTQKFLEAVSKLYELHICTFGARSYAHCIAMFLDPDGRFFSHRILSRDECFDPNSKTANLSSLFPCGDSMVCIIDDREDVWNFAPNLVHVKPYHFFLHTGDINAPPGLSKHDNDSTEHGFDFSKLGQTQPDDKSEATEESRNAQSNSGKTKQPKSGETTTDKDTEDENESKTKVKIRFSLGEDDRIAEPIRPENDARVSIEEKGEIVNSDEVTSAELETNDATLKEEFSKNKGENHRESTKESEDGSKDLLSAENKKKTETDENTLQDTNNDKIVDNGLDQSSENDRGIKEDEQTDENSVKTQNTKDETAAEGMEVDADATHSDRIGDKDEKQSSTDDADVMRSGKSEDKDEKHSSTEQKMNENIPSKGEDTKEDTKATEDTESVNESKDDKEKQVNTDLSGLNLENISSESEDHKATTTEKEGEEAKDDLIEVEDNDDYLLYLEDILRKIHTTFYEQCKPSERSLPDLKIIVPDVKRQVLKGCSLVLSGMVPSHVPLERSRAYMVAQSLGAVVQTDVTPATTHLVAARPGTAKVNSARRHRGIHVVTPQWLWHCAERWDLLDERLYPLGRGARSSRHPPAHCGSPQHPEPTPKAAATPCRFSETINPLLTLSSEDVASMDQEVEELCQDDDSDSEVEEVKKSPILRPIASDNESSSAESLSGQKPKGWEEDDIKKSRKRKMDTTTCTESDFEDESPSVKFRRGEPLPSDFDFDDVDDSQDQDNDDSAWALMGAALEREFLSGD